MKLYSQYSPPNCGRVIKSGRSPPMEYMTLQLVVALRAIIDISAATGKASYVEKVKGQGSD